MYFGKPIAFGNTAKIYLHDGKIIKIFKDHLPVTEATAEAKKQKFAYSQGLNVPKVLDVTEFDGKQAIIMEYIKGRTLGEVMLENFHQAEQLLKRSIEVQQRIHTIVAEPLESMSEKLRKHIEKATKLTDKHKAFLMQSLDSMPLDNKLCHGDFHLFNLILTEHNKVTIIDWVDSCAGDVRADICRTYLLYLGFSTELAEMYLQLYLEKTEWTKEEIIQWLPIIAGARLAENLSPEDSKCLMDIVDRYCSLYFH